MSLIVILKMATNNITVFQTYWENKLEVKFEIPFSERLLGLLYFNTDVGLIPRGQLELSLASSYDNSLNWSMPIQGCYWCSFDDTSHQAICCSFDCLYLFHEWCIRKVNDTTQFSLCILPGCEEELERDSQFESCSEAHFRIYNAEYGMLLLNGTNPHWYRNALEQQPMQSMVPQSTEDELKLDTEINSEFKLDTEISSEFKLDTEISSEFKLETEISSEFKLETEISSDGFSLNEDFETAAANVRTKIDTYFSQLLETIRNRQTNLISKLNDSLSRYRLERVTLRNKVRELEGKERYYTESTPSKYSIIVQRSDAELLVQLRRDREYHETMRVEFEWSRKYAREASKIGYLKLISTLDTLDSNIPFAPETPVSEQDDPDSVTFKAKRTRIFDFDTNSLSPLSNKICRLKPKLKK